MPNRRCPSICKLKVTFYSRQRITASAKTKKLLEVAKISLFISVITVERTASGRYSVLKIGTHTNARMAKGDIQSARFRGVATNISATRSAWTYVTSRRKRWFELRLAFQLPSAWFRRVISFKCWCEPLELSPLSASSDSPMLLKIYIGLLYIIQYEILTNVRTKEKERSLRNTLIHGNNI